MLELATDLKGARAEITRLRHELAEVQEKALRFDLDSAGIKRREQEATELVQLRAELAECRKDAARYQWLRSINCPWPGVFQHEGHDDYGWSAIDGQDLDAAIDAALAAKGE